MATEAAATETIQPIAPRIHLDPQQTIKVMEADVRINDFVTVVRDQQAKTVDYTVQPIPAGVFFQRVDAAMRNARAEKPGQFMPQVSKEQTILHTVEDVLYSSLAQMSPERAQREYWNSFGPKLHSLSPNEQVTSLTEARDIYTERLEHIEGIRLFQQLGANSGVIFTDRLMKSLPTVDQMNRARTVLKYLNDATRGHISSLDTQALPSTTSLQTQLKEVEHLLWAN